jgi:ribonuclease H2 subunit A
MVYAVFYLPLRSHHSLLAAAHRFDDSKVLTPAVRSALVETLCMPGSDLFAQCGWATRVMSARDISAGMLRPAGAYNLNAQAMDATVELIKEVFAMGVNVKEIYVDTIGSPAVYQKKLERIFPTSLITVAKKADSLYPCVSAASVCAKVTRDAALSVSHWSYAEDRRSGDGWGSGYPSDARCTGWLMEHMDPVFGWGCECRFAWSTAKELLDAGGGQGVKVDWPGPDDEGPVRLADCLVARQAGREEGADGLSSWFCRPAAETAF